MKKNGFTLVELLVSLAVLGIVLAIGIYSTKGTLATSLTGFRNVSDNEIFTAARNYVIGENISLENGYTCVYVKDLVDYGYIENIESTQVLDRLVKVSRSNITKTIDKINYVDTCE